MARLSAVLDTLPGRARRRPRRADGHPRPRRAVVGESGIGKSECALDLVVRGHRLVADDAVELRCRAQSFLIGTCPELTRHHMEIRGLGLINVQDLFGVASTRSSKRVELVVQLERWEHGRGVRSPRPRRRVLRDARHPHPDDPDAGRARAATSRSSWRSPRATSCCASRGHHAARRLVERLNEQLGTGDASGRRSSPEKTSDAREAPRRHGAPRARPSRPGSSSSPGCPGPASRRRSARSRTSATSASTTCR